MIQFRRGDIIHEHGSYYLALSSNKVIRIQQFWYLDVKNHPSAGKPEDHLNDLYKYQIYEVVDAPNYSYGCSNIILSDEHTIIIQAELLPPTFRAAYDLIVSALVKPEII
jgi:hypothetical protein